MKKMMLCGTILTCLGGFLGASSAQAAEPMLNFFVEDSPPLASRDPNGTWHGFAALRVIEMMRRTGYSYDMTVLPWRRAYEGAQTQTNACVYATGRTEERKNLFKWVSPIAYGGASLYQLADDTRIITSMNDVVAQHLKAGVQSGDVSEETLKAIPGITLEAVSAEENNIKKLQAGRIDVWVGGHNSGTVRAKELGIKVKRTLDVKIVEVALACNLAIDDAVIARMNAALQEMWKDGTAELYEKQALTN